MDQFKKCLHLSYGILLVTFIFVGCVGYLTFGSETKNIIILNLPGTFEKKQSID